MRTQVNVQSATREKLKDLRASLGLKSVDDVIWHLVRAFEGEDQEPAVDNSDSDGRDTPPRRRKINVREPLYTFDVMAEREGMLEYYTGFDRLSIQLLSQRMEEVCSASSFFCSPSSVVVVPVSDVPLTLRT